jgi:hypothetical protein
MHERNLPLQFLSHTIKLFTVLYLNVYITKFVIYTFSSYSYTFLVTVHYYLLMYFLFKYSFAHS